MFCSGLSSKLFNKLINYLKKLRTLKWVDTSLLCYLYSSP